MDLELEKEFLDLVVMKRTRDCWGWAGPMDENWRPIFRGIGAHRVMYRIHNGEIPRGYEVHHKCECNKCLNPRHLIALSVEDHDLVHSTTDETVRKEVYRGNGPKIRAARLAAAKLRQEMRDMERSKTEENERLQSETLRQAFIGALNQARKPLARVVVTQIEHPNIQADEILELTLRKQKEFRDRIIVATPTILANVPAGDILELALRKQKEFREKRF
jgi:hypothetical protein